MYYRKFISNSERETRIIAQELGRGLGQSDCLALMGDFGSGKTTFVQGLVKGLGFRKKGYVSSPSFVILKIYPGRWPVYHFDLYRIHRQRDLESIGFSELVAGAGISVIEWAEKVKKQLPAGHLKIEFSILGPRRRGMKFSTSLRRLKRLLDKVIGRTKQGSPH